MRFFKYWYWVVFVAVLFLFIFFTRLVSIYVDWLWFNSVNFSQIFIKILATKIGLFFGLGLLFFLIAYINIFAARIATPKARWVVKENIIEIPDIDRYRRIFERFLMLGVAVFSLMLASGFTIIWDMYLKFVYGESFGALDPIFGIDIGFFVFKLPFIKFVYGLIMFGLFVSAIIIAVYYFLFGSIRVTTKGLVFSKQSEIHMSLLGAVAFAMMAYGYRMGMFDLLYSSRGIIFGAGFTDVNASLPMLWILLVLSCIVSLSFVVNAFKGGWRIPAASLIVLLAFSIVIKPIYPEIVQRLYVSPNEIVKESPYIKLNIEYTRKAYKLDKVSEKEFPVEDNLVLADLRANEGTISNIRLWDHRPLLSTYGQIQEIRTYYDFVDVDIDRYTIGGRERQVMLSARELNYGALPSKIWINEHLTYTHGYGVALSPVNKITEQGLPDLLIKDIPPSFPSDIRLDRPEIYYGEIANDYCFVKTKSKEFNYPAGEKNVYTEYVGEGGIPISSLMRKALLAVRLGTLKIFMSGDIRNESRVMMYRRVRERILKIAPFIRYDNDPYVVIADGKLYWMLDGYTITDMYPYSDPYAGLGNYIRNSVKVVLDAYDGSVDLYVSDPEDPIVKTYAKIFPGAFKSMDQMPSEIKEHVRYPEVMFAVQSRKFATYHMTDPQVFYNKEDQWSIAKETFEGDVRAVEPYYTIMKLPGEKKEEFILMIPFTPIGKDNMSAWMCVRCDEEHYGELLTYRFPKRKLIYGPMQIEARIDQDPEISKVLSLWSQRGSTVIRGNLLVIPIENSLLYIEPLYLKAERGQLPELKRVIVAYGNRIAMEETLDNSLRSIFGGKVIRKDILPSMPSTSKNIDDLIKEAGERFRKAEQYLRQGNWSAYGDEMDKLGETLKKLEQF